MRTQAICQNHRKLLAITTFSFDLSNTQFVRYYVSRMGDRIDENGNGPYRAYSPCNAAEWHQTCVDIMEAADTVNRLRRAKLQDCWEIFCTYEMPKLQTAVA